MHPTIATILGLSAGGLYFWYGEANQEKESNCSYLAPAMTDFLAMSAGLVLSWQGHRSDNPWVAGIGGAIAGIHTGQYLHHKLAK